MKKLKLLLFALMVATCTFKAYSQAVVYNFDVLSCPTPCASDACNGSGNPLPSSLNTAVIAATSAFNLGPGLGTGINCGPMNGYSTGNPNPPPNGRRARWADNWPLSLTVNPNLDYFTFTLTTNPFDLVQIDQISWQDRRSDTGPTLRQVRTSADSYTTPFAVAINTGTGWVTRSVTAGLPSFNGSIQIRIYGYGNLPPVSGGTGTNAGSLRIDNVRIFATVVLTNLPIELLSFTGEKVDDDVLLRWSTASEEDNDFFTIFRSLDMQDWQEIAVVPGAGTSQSRIDYQLVDEFPHLGTNYYKLRQTDFDGTFEDSHVIAVDFDVGNTFIAFPNPTARGHPIQTSKHVDFVIDQLGRLTAFENNAIEQTGVYTLVHIDENGIQTTCRIVVTTK
jgi:hypothetical protein